MSYNPNSFVSPPSYALGAPYPKGPFVTLESSGGTTNDTARLQAFVDWLADNTSGIRTGHLISPNYYVDSLELVGRDGISLIGAGTNGAVNIVGRTASGGDQIVDLYDAGGAIYTREITLQNLVVIPQTPGGYNYGVRSSAVVRSNFINFSTAGAFAVNAELHDLIFLNTFIGGTVQNTTAQTTGFQFGNNNINMNTFLNRRFFAKQAGGAGLAKALALGASRGNMFIGCDIGTADIAIDCEAVFGVSFQNCYSEDADTSMRLSNGALSKAVQWVGGYMYPNVAGYCFRQGANDVYGLTVQQATFAPADAISTVFSLAANCYDAILYPNYISGTWAQKYPAVTLPFLNFNAPNAPFGPFVLGASGLVTIPGSLAVNNHTPASAAAAGVAGRIAWDTNYIYICTATNTWKRVAVATW